MFKKINKKIVWFMLCQFLLFLFSSTKIVCADENVSPYFAPPIETKTPEEMLQINKFPKIKEKKSNAWKWLLAGALIVGGVLLSSSGGSSNNNSGSTTNNQSNTQSNSNGSIGVSW